jgi:hypothetical protein
VKGWRKENASLLKQDFYCFAVPVRVLFSPSSSVSCLILAYGKLRKGKVKCGYFVRLLFPEQQYDCDGDGDDYGDC